MNLWLSHRVSGRRPDMAMPFDDIVADLDQALAAAQASPIRSLQERGQGRVRTRRCSSIGKPPCGRKVIRWMGVTLCPGIKSG